MPLSTTPQPGLLARDRILSCFLYAKWFPWRIFLWTLDGLYIGWWTRYKQKLSSNLFSMPFWKNDTLKLHLHACVKITFEESVFLTLFNMVVNEANVAIFKHCVLFAAPITWPKYYFQRSRSSHFSLSGVWSKQKTFQNISFEITILLRVIEIKPFHPY